MSPQLLLLLVSIAVSSTQEVQRSNKIRFPNENILQHHNVGPQLFESASQAVPIIISAGANGIANGPHFVLPKVPSAANPFGEIGTKGYAEGIIIPHTSFHPTKTQKEFHQTVPPPLRIPYGLPQSFVMYKQQLASQGPQQQQQQPERHRFAVPPRITYNQLKQMNQNQYAHHQIFASGMTLTKDAQKHPDVSSYRYSIVTNHGKPRPSHPDEFEMEITHGIPDELISPIPKPRPNSYYNKPKNQHHQQKPLLLAQKKPNDAKRFPNYQESNQGIRLLQDNIQDIISQSKVPYHHKTKKGKKPQVNYPIPSFENHDDFEGFDEFSDFPSQSPPSHKRFSAQRKPEFERKEVKPSYKPIHESEINEVKNKKYSQKFPPSFETIKSIELADGEFYSEENISANFEQKQFKKQEKPPSNLGSNRQYTQKPAFKKPQEQNSNVPEIKFGFTFPERPERGKKPLKQQNIDFSLDFPHQNPLKKYQHKQQNPSPNYDFDFSQINAYKQGSNQEGSNFGSDWIPINAPEGIGPARSYNIPAPDLSKDFFKDQQNFARDWDAEDVDDDNFRFSSSETVYGVQKGGHSGEEVVSATFRVKQ